MAREQPLCRSPGELWLKERIAAFDAGNRRKRKEAMLFAEKSQLPAIPDAC